METAPQVMVVSDDPATCDALRTLLAERACVVITLDDAAEAVGRYQLERPAAVILDLMISGASNSLEALAAFKRIDRDVPVIVLSGLAPATTAVQAMKLGAADLVNKPFDTDGNLVTPLDKALAQRRLDREIDILREELQSHGGRADLILGSSASMSAVRDLIRRVAETDTTVLIQGERGTGKELVARAIHASSLRRDKPFVKVNCAARLAESLESELFGFERGAFTGAIHQRLGKFEFASHGTMFLDEIGELSPPLQAKLLAVLRNGAFARLGGTHDVHVDVRVVATSSGALEQAVADGHFREDLWGQLNVVSIGLPSLRDRREEIPTLSDYFLKKYAVQYKTPYLQLSTDTTSLFREYHWPGNVRELEEWIKRIVVLGDETQVRKELGHRISDAAHSSNSPSPVRAARAAETSAANMCLPIADAQAGACSLKKTSRTAAREAERELILKMLRRTRWNRTAAAGILGISYKALLYKIKESGLDKAS